MSKVDVQNLPAEKIQAEKTVNAGARGERMSKHRKTIPVSPHGLYASNNDPGSEFDSAACRNLDSVGYQGCVVAYSRKWRDIDHGASSSRVQRQTQNDAPGRTEHFRFNNHKTTLWIEGVVHRTTAVSSGI